MKIEFVIIHELYHFIHHNPKFYELQTLLLPTWQKWKEHLEKFQIRRINSLNYSILTIINILQRMLK
ncbi:MAG: M48 family metallopeptidase, partial [Ignavibacteriaceae bacterium]|nr:M48 family metallopeptidase [Ignavibacteriaceae bacterium]